MSFRILFLGLIFFSNQTFSSELTVYRWVDKNNVVHFSQHQPVGDEYTQFLVSNQSKIISRADKVNGDISPEDNTALQKNESVISPTIDTSEKCKEAKENVSMLMAFDKVQYTDENGKKQVLTKQEKQQQLAVNKKRTEVYCAPGSEKQ